MEVMGRLARTISGTYHPLAWLYLARLVLVALVVAVGIAAVLLTDRLPTNTGKAGRHSRCRETEIVRIRVRRWC